MEKFVPMIQKLRKAWEDKKRAGMPHAVFESLAIMFPAPCQELYPMIKANGTYHLYLFQREASDKLYAGMYHNPGTVHRTTDGITATSVKNKLAMDMVPDETLEAERSKTTWNLTPRLKALHRVLTGAEISLGSDLALQELTKIHYAGFYPMELTPRGCECADLNVWFPGDAVRLNFKFKSFSDWFDVREIPGLFYKGKIMEHQIDRFASMMDYVRTNLDPAAPPMPRLKEID